MCSRLTRSNANPSLAMKITAVGKSCLIDMFEAHGVLLKEEIFEQIRNKWMIYLNEHIPQIFYVKMQKAVLQESFWNSSLEQCVFTAKINIFSGHKRIYHYWSRVHKICDANGFRKFL